VKLFPATLFRELAPAFCEPPVSLKVVPKPACDRKSAMNVHWKKSTNESKRKPEQKFDAAFGTIFGISKCFQRSKQNFTLVFLLNRQDKNL
jgi:hypothetical protein